MIQNNNYPTAGSCAFIDDGYNEKAYIRAEKGLFPEVRFVYRPILVESRAVIFAQSENLKPEEQKIKSAEIMAAKIQSWDVTDSKGNAVELTAKNLLKIKPFLFEQLWAIILGATASDLDPLWDQEEKQRIANQQLDAIIHEGQTGEPTSPGTQREVADAKN